MESQPTLATGQAVIGERVWTEGKTRYAVWVMPLCTTEILRETLRVVRYVDKLLQAGKKSDEKNVACQITPPSDMPSIVAKMTTVIDGRSITLIATETTTPQQLMTAAMLLATGTPLGDVGEPPVVNTPQQPPAAQQSPNGSQYSIRASALNNPQFKNGDTVSWLVNKIVKSTNAGSPTYQFWGPAGVKYPLHTVYVKGKSGGDSKDWSVAGELLKALGLSVDEGKVEAHGQWRFTAQVQHAPQPDGKVKEYLHVVELVAVGG